MTENLSHSSVCLRVYIESGRKALVHLQQGMVDDAITALRKRKASFGNFRVADYKLEKTGVYAADRADLTALWQTIAEQDKALAGALQSAMDQLSGELRRIKGARKSLASFKSSQPMTSQFRKQV